MKKLFLILCLLLISALIFTQAKIAMAQEKSIAVPVRVFEENEFVDNLNIQDFEIYQDGVKQQIKALYLAQKDRIVREEGSLEIDPDVSRTFYLLFQLTEYNPKIADSIEYFFSDVITENDSLEIMTPMKNYTLTNQALQSMPREKLAEEMIKIVRKDTQTGSSQYKSLMRDLRRIVSSLSGSSSRSGFEFEEDSSIDSFGIEFLLPRYRETLSQIEQLRLVNQTNFLEFARQLKNKTGQKFVYFIYEREFRPEIQPRIIQELTSMLQDKPHILGNLQDLMAVYSREPKLDTQKIMRAYSDAGIYFNFLFIDKKPSHYSGIQMHEQSEDVFNSFSKTAKATGGDVYTTQNPLVSFKNCTQKNKNYYLLYYTPEKASEGDKFNTIEVKTKNKKYKLSYRSGYITY
ncbi:MAG: VWA domain-containing protein [Candidatus Aminicenantes bacterium]|nr:VWA domain-containing protein [Candidatus Aminicenantes bacterium]